MNNIEFITPDSSPQLTAYAKLLLITLWAYYEVMADNCDNGHIVSNITHWNEIYFGRGLSIPTGSSVTLVYPNGTKISFQWGITKKLPQVTSMRLDRGQRGTRNELARIVATKVERQWDYFATLSVGDQVN